MITRRDSTRLVAALAICVVALAPRLGRAEGLLDQELTLALAVEPDQQLPAGSEPDAKGPAAAPEADLRVPAATVAKAKPVKAKPVKAKGEDSLDFDLLGDAPKPLVPAEDPSLRTRRKMLNLHQGLGLGLLGLQVASTTTGQLNYNDKFGTANTARYKQTHQILTYTNLAAFAVVGGLALFAPTEKNAPTRPFGRTTIHKIGMGVAAAGMLSQGLLGIQTARREGYLDKQDYGRAHLAVGYATLAAMAVGVGVIVF